MATNLPVPYQAQMIGPDGKLTRIWAEWFRNLNANVLGGSSDDAITALTGDVTATGPGSVASSISSGVIVNSKISSSAAIGRSKLASGTASHVLVNDSLGVMSSEANLAVSRGGTNSGTALNNNRIMQSSGGKIVEAAALTADYALVSDSNGIPIISTVTGSELGYLSGVTGGIQDQLDGKQTTDLATGKILIGDVGGSAAAQSVTGDVSLSTAGVTAYSGTVPLNKGGTGQTTKSASFDALSPMSTLGDTVYGGASGTGTRLAGNTTTTKKFLTQTGNGSVSAAPAWGTIAAADVPTLNQNTTGTASNITGTVAIANGGTGQTTKASGFDALSPMSASGDIIYGGSSGTGTRLAKGSDGQVLTLASGVPAWTSAPSGGVEFITNGKAESDTSGWATYADAAGASPVNGTGGSPTVTWTRSTSSPLAGTASFVFTKDAANRQGDGASYDFTIDTAYQAKVLQIQFEYMVGSGTFSGGTSSADSDITVWIYDVTNGALIQPTTYKLYASSTSISTTFIGNFQTASNSTSYRLIFHCASTSSSSYTVKFDQVSVSPCRYVYGSPITDFKSFTPTGSWVSNTTYTGSYRMVGDIMEIRYFISCTGAPTSAALTLNLPSGCSIDTSKLPGGTSYAQVLSSVGHAVDAGSNNYEILGRYSTTTAIEVVVQNSASTYGLLNTGVNATTPFTFGSGDLVSLSVSVPILGLSSSVQVSDNASSRIVGCTVNSSTTSISSGSDDTVVFTAIEGDNLGSYNASTGIFTLSVSGDFEVGGKVAWGSSFSMSAGGTIRSGIKVDGSVVKYVFDYVFPATLNTTHSTQYGSTILRNLRAGQTISFSAFQNSGSARTLSADSARTYMTINRLANPQTMSATPTVSCTYTKTATQSLSATTATNITFPVKSHDTHSAFDGTKFTAPYPGKYRISVFCNPSTFVAGATWYLHASKSSATMTYRIGCAYSPTISSQVGISAGMTFDLLSGENIYVVAYATNAATIEGVGTLSIEMVK